MKLACQRSGDLARPVVVLGRGIGLDLPAVDPALAGDWSRLLPDLERIRRLVAEHPLSPEDSPAAVRPPFVALADDLLLPPVREPGKIVAVGRNYQDHADEQRAAVSERPLLFAKATTCLQRPFGPILLDADLDQVDAEAELAVVIGTAGRAIPRERAAAHVAGYTCFNDVSDRAAQFADKQWFRGKSIDTGGPCGPWIVTPDELPPLAAGLAITCRWNGTVMQRSDTGRLIFPVDELISFASRHMTLLPGDIIATGTPGGVGVFRDPPVFLRPGDMVEVEIERIGTIRNPVQARP
jgi:2,4-diketo-3-deoxy-L-fuconate hydrolase